MASQTFEGILNRENYFLKITLYCLIISCVVFGMSNTLFQRYEVGLYNFIFGVLFTILLPLRNRNFDIVIILTAFITQLFFFGHAYFILPGKQMEGALGMMTVALPLFAKGFKMWYFVISNFILFHLAFINADYGEVFYFQYIFYIVLFIIIRTITNINKNYEKELMIQRDKIERDTIYLKELDELKARFFANISHELRTPLTLVLSPLDSILDSNELSNRNATYLQLVQQNAKKLLNRINELLELSRLDAKGLAINLAPTNIYQATKQITALYEGAAMLKNIQFNYENTIVESQNLLIDTPKLEMIVSNYLSNAIKFTPKNGQIDVKVRKENATLLISVKDTGIGIPEEELEKIFDRFYQVKEEIYANGSGIGLALSKELADVQGGRVWATSEIGKGSVFYLELAFKETYATVKTTINKPIKQVQKPLKTKYKDNLQTLLIVEDNHDLREYMQLLLSEKYNIVTAENGKEALKWLTTEMSGSETSNTSIENSSPSLIISDIMMPEMDGMELLKVLKSDDSSRQIPVIMLTAQNLSEVKIEALRIGVDDYLTKPFKAVELIARIENLIENAQQRTTELPNSTSTKKPSIISEADLIWLKTVEQKILVNIKNTDFKLQNLATDLFISIRTLQQKIKAITGLTPKQYERKIKLHEARKIVDSGSVQTVAELSYQLGFEDQHYFSKIYKKEFGITPNEALK
jgi:signal transduction histidine kinase/DNA-binding response OmpR family regulator